MKRDSMMLQRYYTLVIITPCMNKWTLKKITEFSSSLKRLIPQVRLFYFKKKVQVKLISNQFEYCFSFLWIMVQVVIICTKGKCKSNLSSKSLDREFRNFLTTAHSCSVCTPETQYFKYYNVTNCGLVLKKYKQTSICTHWVLQSKPQSKNINYSK